MHLPTIFAFALFAYSTVSAVPLDKRETLTKITTSDVPAPLSRRELVLRAYLEARDALDEVLAQHNTLEARDHTHFRRVEGLDFQAEFDPLPQPAAPTKPAWANIRIQPYRPSFVPPSGGGTSSWFSKWKASPPQPAAKKF
ncbi:hypothetical protein K474DRAFT_586395 [Panus rudis PR-1116 ss-1]|nr:hypothetical protein K474DRAFT_586395 [Panus rudis PR-1116 ss-1]